LDLDINPSGGRRFLGQTDEAPIRSARGDLGHIHHDRRVMMRG